MNRFRDDEDIVPYEKYGAPRSLLRGEKEEWQLRLTNSHEMRICR